MPYFDQPNNKLFMIQLLFFCLVLLLVAHKAGKAKRIEKRGARDRSSRFCLQQKITNCPNNRTIYIAGYLYSIRALFVLYFLQLHNNVEY